MDGGRLVDLPKDEIINKYKRLLELYSKSKAIIVALQQQQLDNNVRHPVDPESKTEQADTAAGATSSPAGNGSGVGKVEKQPPVADSSTSEAPESNNGSSGKGANATETLTASDNKHFISDELAKSQQERDFWQLECEILRSKVARMSSSLAGSRTADIKAGADDDQLPNNTPSHSDAGALRSGEAGESHRSNVRSNSFLSPHVDTSSMDKSTVIEEGLRQRYLSKCEEIHQLHSKAVFFQQQYLHAMKLLDASENESRRLRETVEAAQSNIGQLKKQLETTTSEYDTIIRQYSEHIGTLNDQLASQTEELETLKINSHDAAGISSSDSRNSFARRSGKRGR